MRQESFTELLNISSLYSNASSLQENLKQFRDLFDSPTPGCHEGFTIMRQCCRLLSTDQAPAFD